MEKALAILQKESINLRPVQWNRTPEKIATLAQPVERRIRNA